MLFYSYFKTLVGKEVTVELKNDLAITGTLHSVDQYLNVKLNNVKVVNEAKYPHMVSVRRPANSVQPAVPAQTSLRLLVTPTVRVPTKTAPLHNTVALSSRQPSAQQPREPVRSG